MARRKPRSSKFDWNNYFPYLIIVALVLVVAIGYFAPTGKFTDVAQEIVYVVGYDGLIIKSSDGGSTWTEQNSGTDVRLNTVYFINPNKGFAAGYENTLLGTTNGGRTWSRATRNTEFAPSGAEVCLDELCISCGTYCLINDIYFSNNQIGYAAGYGTSFKTTDGGVIWRSGSSERYTSNNNTVFFLDENTGYLGADGGRIYKTTDGTNFELIRSGGNANVEDIYFIDEDTGFFVTSYGGVHKTTDGGSNWAQKLNSGNLRSIQFTNENTGYAAGSEKIGIGSGQYKENGAIFKTTDGGENWESLDLTVAEEEDQYGVGWVPKINSIHFTNSDIGYAVGSRGLVLRTTDAGETWIVKETDTETVLKSVYVIMPTACVDSDGGQDPSVKGTISGDVPPGFETEDSCEGDNLLETYCDSEDANDDGYAGTVITTTCPNGCEEGRCLTDEEVEEEQEEVEDDVTGEFDDQYLYTWASGKTFEELIKYECEETPCPPRVFVNGMAGVEGEYTWRKGTTERDQSLELLDADMQTYVQTSAILRLDIDPAWVVRLRILGTKNAFVKHATGKLADSFYDLPNFFNSRGDQLREGIDITLEGSKGDRIEINIDGRDGDNCPEGEQCPIDAWNEDSTRPGPYTAGFFANIGGNSAGNRIYSDYFNSDTYIELIEVIPTTMYEERFNQAQHDFQDYYRLGASEGMSPFEVFILKGGTKWKRDGFRVLLDDSDTPIRLGGYKSGAINLNPKYGHTVTLQVTVDNENYFDDIGLDDLQARVYGVEFDDSPSFGKERITFTLNGYNEDYLGIDIDSEWEGINEFSLQLSRTDSYGTTSKKWSTNEDIDANVWVEIITGGGTSDTPSIS